MGPSEGDIERVGFDEGSALGCSVGCVPVGLELGEALGLIVIVGELEGPELGLLDGRALGFVEGKVVGLFDGLVEGETVGVSVVIVDVTADEGLEEGTELDGVLASSMAPSEKTTEPSSSVTVPDKVSLAETTVPFPNITTPLL